MNVDPQERAAMLRLMQIMNGESVAPLQESATSASSQNSVLLEGPGVVSQADITAMAQVLKRLDNVMQQTSENMVTESTYDHKLKEALVTEKDSQGVKIGVYKIQVHLDESRVAGKQYYDVVNQATHHVLAHELSLYEAAHGLVRLLNSGKYINSQEVRELLEAEAAYTSHRIDAIRYARMAKKANLLNDSTKAQLYETRKQASMDRSSQAKAKVKSLYQNT